MQFSQHEELKKRDQIAMERWEASQTVPPDTGAEHALIQSALRRRP